MAATVTSSNVLSIVRRFVPQLTSELHKGQCGRIGIVGGSFEYTGAPYYAAMAALKTGADISHIFCDVQAATAIKSYSPELIVHPVLQSMLHFTSGLDSSEIEHNAEENASKVAAWFPSLHAIAVGPGLGRDPLMLKTAATIIKLAREQHLPIIIDGDALFLLSQENNINLIKGYKRCILTPNAVEYSRMTRPPQSDEPIASFASRLGNIAVIKKGTHDVVSNGKESIECTEASAPRRCGGQGDLLVGALTTFIAWANLKSKSTDSLPMILEAAHAASTLVRNASGRAFEKHKRSMTSVDVLHEIGGSFYDLFDRDNTDGSSADAEK